MVNIWYFIIDLFNVVVNVGQKIWEFLTTPINTLIASIDFPGWLDALIGAPLRWIFQSNITILQTLPILLIIILIVKFVFLFIK